MGQPMAFSGFLLVVGQRQVFWEVQTELGYLFVRQSNAWKFGALFRRGLVSGSLVSGVWVLLVEFQVLDFSGDAAFK